jgi:hypothetical protein
MSDQYSPGIEVKGKLFYGRAEQLRAIRSSRWVWVCGQRRMGKSSLLQREAERTESEDGWIALYYSLHLMKNPKTDGGDELFQQFLRSVVSPKELRDRAIDDERLKFLASLRSSGFKARSAGARFRQLVERLCERFRGVVFLWDEAEGLINVEENERKEDPQGFLGPFHEALRGDARFRLVLAGTQLLSRLFDYKLPGGGSFLLDPPLRWVPVPGLDREEARGLLLCSNAQTLAWKPPILEAVLDEAIRWSGGHPFILQTIGARLVELSQQARLPYKGDSVNRGILDRCFANLVKDAIYKHVFEDDFQKLTKAQQAILSRLCTDARSEREGIPAGELRNVADALQWPREDSLWFLQSYGYATEGDPVRLRIPFYREFYREMPPDVIGRSHAKASVQEISASLRPGQEADGR